MEKDGDLDKLYLEDEEEEELGTVPVKRVPTGDVYEAARAGDVERLKQLLEEGGVNVNARDRWDSVALYYACLAGHLDAARMLLESGAICAEHTFDGDRCHYAALNLRIRRLLKSFEARPPPLGPLQSSLRSLFLSCPANRVDQYSDTGSGANEEVNWDFPSDITFYVQGRPIEAHRAILVARSSFFKRKFETDWKYRREIRFSKKKLSYAALYSLIYFFYCDRLDIAVDDMEDLVRICKVCRCEGLKNALEKEINHQKYAEYKSLRESDNSQKRFILQGLSLPEEERLPAALQKLLQVSFERSKRENEGPQASFISESTNVAQCSEDVVNNVQQNGNAMDIGSYMSILSIEKKEGKGELFENQSKGMELCCHHANETSLEDHSDVCFTVGGRKFRAHQAILASRSEYFKARLSRVSGFLEGKEWKPGYNLPVLEEHDLSAEAFEKLLEYMYTDRVEHVEPDQAEEMFDAASRYLVFPLKRAVADALLPHIRTASPAELCQWLMLSDLYGVWKIREHCLNEIALDFELFADTPEFRKMLLILPPPSGDSSQRTSAPSAPGEDGRLKEGNILDDLREKWLEAEGAELDQRDASAYQFDKRLEMLILQAAHENQQIQN